MFLLTVAAGWAPESLLDVPRARAVQEGGKYIENTQMPGLVKQEWDWHINRKNPVSPEFTDAILESGKWIHLAKRLDFGNRYQHQHSHSHSNSCSSTD